MTPDIRWLSTAIEGAVLLALALGLPRGSAPGHELHRLTRDRTRMALLAGLPFLIRLFQTGPPDYLPTAYPPMTLPMAAPSVWLVSVALLALPVLHGLGANPSKRRPWLPAFGVAVVAVFLCAGLSGSPFDRGKLEQALAEHRAFCEAQIADASERAPELRDSARQGIDREIQAAREEASAVFEARGFPPAESLLRARRASVERLAADLRRAAERRRLELEELERRRRLAESAPWYGR